MEVSRSGRTRATRWNDGEERTGRKKFIRSKRLQLRIADVATLGNSPINRFIITSELKHSALMREIHYTRSRDSNLAAGSTFRGHRLCHPYSCVICILHTGSLKGYIRPRISFRSKFLSDPRRIRARYVSISFASSWSSLENWNSKNDTIGNVLSKI